MFLKQVKLLGIILVFAGCTNQMEKGPVYRNDGIVYNVVNNKPVNGIVKREVGGIKEFSTYQKGILKNLKKIDWEETLIEEINYDDMGLTHGLVKTREMQKNYSHGRLMGDSNEKYYGTDITRYYIDGVVHSQEVRNKEVKFFNRGVEVETDPGKITISEVKKVWGELPEKKYTGEVYSNYINNGDGLYYAALEVKGYKDGILEYIKFYTKDGIKLLEYSLYNGDINKRSRSLEYINGYLNEELNYNEDGELNGVVIKREWDKITTKLYVDGILHGDVKAFNFKTQKNSSLGHYKLGVFTGEMDGCYYNEGLESKDYIIKKVLPLEIKEDIEEENFTGLVRKKDEKGTFIDQYEDGKVLKRYTYSNGMLEKITTTPDEKGYSSEELYHFGLLTSKFSYNRNKIRDGEFLSIEHKNSLTKGNFTNGSIDGKSIHYHGEKIIYIDTYNENSYNRVSYYDYEKNQVSGRSKGIYSKEIYQWIKVDEEYEYYENGNIKVKKDYGKENTTTKQVKYYEYYENGNIKSKYMTDYCGWKIIGEQIEYSLKGKIKERTIYNTNGQLTNKKIYSDKEKLIENISYDEYGRVLDNSKN